MMRCLLVALLLLAAGCGTGTDGQPVAPTTPPPAPAPKPRVCTDERNQALAFYSPILVREWAGAPFRFYLDGGLPESERADAEHFFGVVERLSQRIEEQLGYSILEPEGWIAEADRGFGIARGGILNCEGPPPGGVRPGGIVLTVVPMVAESTGLPPAKAKPECAVAFYLNNDLAPSFDGVLTHELFHLFGFTHSPDSTHPQQTPPGMGVAMSVHLTQAGYPAPRDLGVTFEDVDALRCIFPEGG